MSHNNPWSGISMGLGIFEIWSKLSNCGLSPPCIHIILSSISADTGIVLNTSENSFHSFRLYLLLPKLIQISYIHHRIHTVCWYWSIRGCLSEGKSSQETWSCRPIVKWYIRLIVFLDQHSRRWKGNFVIREFRSVQIF